MLDIQQIGHEHNLYNLELDTCELNCLTLFQLNLAYFGCGNQITKIQEKH